MRLGLIGIFSVMGVAAAVAVGLCACVRAEDLLFNTNIKVLPPRLDVHLGHIGGVDMMGVSRDGKTIATSSSDKTLRLWDGITGRETRIIPGAGLMEVMAFSPDGTRLFTAGRDQTLQAWDLSKGSVLFTKDNCTFDCRSISLSPDGTQLALGDLGRVLIVDADTGVVKQKFPLASRERCLAAFSPDGKEIAAATKNVTILDAATGKELRKLAGHDEEITSLFLDGKIMATASSSEPLAKLWDASTGKALYSIKACEMPKQKNVDWSNFETVESIALSPDGKSLATSGATGALKIWNTETGKERQILKNESQSAKVLNFSSDGRTLFGLMKNGNLKTWDTASGKEVLTIEPHYSPILAAAVSADGKTMVTSPANNCFLKFWEFPGGKNVVSLPGEEREEQFGLECSPDGQIVTATSGNDLKLYDRTNGKLVRTIPGGAALTVAFSPDSKTLLTAANKTVATFEVSSGKRLLALKPQANRVLKVVYAPDGKIFAVAAGSEIQFFDAITGNPAGTISGKNEFTKMSFNPNGSMLAACDDRGDITLFDPKTYKELRVIKWKDQSLDSALFAVKALWSKLEFSHDGKLLAGCGPQIKIWDPSSGDELRTLSGHVNLVGFIAFTPDDRKLVSASRDGTIRLWDTQSGKELAAIYPVDKNDYIVATPDGKFDTSPGAAKFLDPQVKKENQQAGLLTSLLGEPVPAGKTASD